MFALLCIIILTEVGICVECFSYFLVQGAVEKFIKEYLPGHQQMKTIGSMLKAVDKNIAKMHQKSTDQLQGESFGYSSEATKEMESLQAENQALKAQLISQLEDVKKENDHLKQTLETMKSSQSNHDEQVAMLLKEIQELKGRLEAEITKNSTDQVCAQLTPLSNRVKAFNSIPKIMRDFYNQMEIKNGSEEIPKFSELGEYKTNRSTKAAYCKRKAIFSFIKAYGGGVDECLLKYDHLSPLQLYDQHIKKTREANW